MHFAETTQVEDLAWSSLDQICCYHRAESALVRTVAAGGDGTGPSATQIKEFISSLFWSWLGPMSKFWPVLASPLGLLRILGVCRSIGFDFWELSLKGRACLASLSAKLLPGTQI